MNHGTNEPRSHRDTELSISLCLCDSVAHSAGVEDPKKV